jgi:molecular chaperone DnaJ
VIVRADADYYDVLGVPREADKKTIKQAYRQKARKFHPVSAGEASVPLRAASSSTAMLTSTPRRTSIKRQAQKILSKRLERPMRCARPRKPHAPRCSTPPDDARLRQVLSDDNKKAIYDRYGEAGLKGGMGGGGGGFGGADFTNPFDLFESFFQGGFSGGGGFGGMGGMGESRRTRAVQGEDQRWVAGRL